MHRLQAHNLFHIPKMMCDRCVAALTSALHTVDGVARVEADLMARTVRVVSRHYESALLRTLREAGFPAEPVLQPLG
ncbi:MAG TPA: cation transporter [Microvirga sp.]|jgi:copper chaperone|nr:cation transporter [Microvirga sp.]